MRNSHPPARSLWLRLGLAVAAPLVFFAMLEAGLRLGGYGRDTRFFIPDEQPGVYRTNPRFTELFFPASFGLKPVNFRLMKQKPSGTVRVFVLGESAAMGVPEPAFGLAPQLQAQLRAVRPGERIEVFNLGVTAINSHAIVEIARQAVLFEPDLLVIYMGNNEVVGPYGVSSVVTAGTPPRALIRAGLRLRQTRTGQLLQRVVGAAGARRDTPAEWGGMEMFAGRTAAADDPRLATVYAHFDANLEHILRLARRAKVPAIVSTVAVNVRDSAPFASLPSLPPTALDDAVRYRGLEDDAGLRRSLEAAVLAAPGYADAHFQLARMFDAQGDAAAARDPFLEALQQDALRFRADARINTVIRKATQARAESARLVDAARILGADASSSGPMAGNAHFFEHVHLTQAGTYALARELASEAAMMLWQVERGRAPWLDTEACAAVIGFTAFGELAQLEGMKELTGRPPFSGQSLFAEDRTRLEGQIERLRASLGQSEARRAALATVEQAVLRDPENLSVLFQAAQVRLQTGDFSGALALNERLASLAPASPEAAVQRAFLLQILGRGGEAVDLLVKTAEGAPYYFQTYSLLAVTWMAGNQGERAVAWFAERVRRLPDNRVLRGAYAQVLAFAGDRAGAEREWRALLAYTPDDERALAPLVDTLVESDRLAEATALMEQAFVANPRSYSNNVRLAQVYDYRGDTERHARSLAAVADSGPANARLHVELAGLYARLGKAEDEQIAWLAARRLARLEGDTGLLRLIEAALRSSAP